MTKKINIFNFIVHACDIKIWHKSLAPCLIGLSTDNHYKVLGPRSNPTKVEPDLHPICLTLIVFLKKKKKKKKKKMK